MEKQGWKVMAIIELVLLILFISLGIYGVYQDNKEIEKTNICYYEVCADSPQAYYEEGICTCYDYDNLGQIYPSKTKLLN